MTFGANLSGFRQLNQRLAQLSKDEGTKAAAVANRAGAVVLRKATAKEAPNSPKTTEGETRTRHNRGGTTRTETHGKIKNNVIVRKTKSVNTHQVQTSVGIRSKAYHASFVQFGSIHNTADPFMLHALQNNEQPIIEAIARSLNKQLVRRGV